MKPILIVDDSPMNLELLQAILEANDYSVLKAENGEEAMEVLKKEIPEIVISDIMMPKMNGFRLCREMKANEAWKTIPFVFYTATFLEREDEELAMALGASRFIVKPVEGEAFMKIIHDVLSDHSKGLLPTHTSPLENEEELLAMYDGSLSRKLEESIEQMQLQYKQLESSQKKLKEAEEIAQLGHWELDIRKDKLAWSDQIFRIFGLRPQELVPSYAAFLDIIHPNDRDMVQRAYEESLQKKTSYSIDHRLLMKDGTIKYVHEQCQTQYDDYGKALYSIGTVQDITARKMIEQKLMQEMDEHKRLQDQLLQAQKMEAIGTLAGGIAHDFNNILAGIIGYTELALSESEPGSSHYDSIAEILQFGKRARKLVKQILTFSRQTEIEVKPININETVKEINTLLRASISQSIEIDIEANCSFHVMADSTQLHQVLLNLCTNAAHAIEGSGSITISARDLELSQAEVHQKSLLLQPGKYVIIDVTDTGCGFNDDIKKRIFDPFFTTKEKGSGTGLGLSQVHGIIKRHNGDIAVESEVGKGTTFSVYIPARIPTESSQTYESQEFDRGCESILIVDDEEMLAKLNKKILSRLGYNVIAVSSSLEALDIFRHAPDNFDLIITDFSMPNMNGNELIHNIHRVRKDIPVILCSGFFQDMNQEVNNEDPYTDFLLKPILKDDLVSKVQEMLEKAAKDH